VEAELAVTAGRIPGAGFVVVAMGKLGGREMTASSDLDLVFVYDVPPGIELSDGPKPLSPTLYFARLAQRLIAAITAPTGEGRLYEVDMRLRPSGNSGPIASSLEGFRRYQQADAWTWEHMALTRARVVAGNRSFALEVESALHELLTRPRDPEKLMADVAAMRRRIAQQHPADRAFELKHMAGGMVDIEFIAQYLMLRHAAKRPNVLAHGTDGALVALARAELLSERDFARLHGALSLWRRLHGYLRLTVGERFEEASLAPAIARRLAEIGGAVDYATLRKQISATAAAVHAIYVRIVEAQEERAS